MREGKCHQERKRQGKCHQERKIARLVVLTGLSLCLVVTGCTRPEMEYPEYGKVSSGSATAAVALDISWLTTDGWYENVVKEDEGATDSLRNQYPKVVLNQDGNGRILSAEIPAYSMVNGQIMNLTPTEWRAKLGAKCKTGKLSSPMPKAALPFLQSLFKEWKEDGKSWAYFRLDLGNAVLVGIAPDKESPVERVSLARVLKPEEAAGLVWSSVDVPDGDKFFMVGEPKKEEYNGFPWYHLTIMKKLTVGTEHLIANAYVPCFGKASGFSPDSPGAVELTGANPLNISTFQDISAQDALLVGNGDNTDGKLDLKPWVSMGREDKAFSLTNLKTGETTKFPVPAFMIEMNRRNAGFMETQSLIRLEAEGPAVGNRLTLRVQILYGWSLDLLTTQFQPFHADVALLDVQLSDQGDIVSVNGRPAYTVGQAEEYRIVSLKEARLGSLGIGDDSNKLDAWLKQLPENGAFSTTALRADMLADGIVSYNAKGMQILTYGPDRYVLSMSVSNPEIPATTPRGLKLGMARADVFSLYGNPLQGSGKTSEWVYLINLGQLSSGPPEPGNLMLVGFEGDKVTSMSMQTGGFGLLK